MPTLARPEGMPKKAFSTLTDILGAEELIAAVDQFRAVAKPLPYHSLFLKGQKGEVKARTARFEQNVRPRGLGAIRSRQSRPYRVRRAQRKFKRIEVMTTSVSTPLRTDELFEEAAIGQLVPDADIIVASAIKDVLSMVYRAVEKVCADVLTSANGVTVNPTIFPGSNQAFSYAFPINEITAGAKWDVAATKVFSGNNQLYDAVRLLESNGYKARHFITSGAPIKALIGNTEAQGWFQNNGAISLQAVQDFARGIGNGSIQDQSDYFNEPNAFDGVAGIKKWHSWDHNFKNDGGVVTNFHPDTVGLLLPDEFDFLGFAEGFGYVPTGKAATNALGLTANVADLLRQQKGVTVYVLMDPYPPFDIEIVATFTFVPAVLDENAVVALKTIL